MSNDFINQTRQSYRRGLVLGFTVAEALLLILFGILLALGSIIVTKNRERDDLKSELSIALPKLAAIDAIKASFPDDAEQNFEDFFGELTLAISERDAAQAQAATLTEKAHDQEKKLQELRRAEKIISDASGRSEGAVEALRSEAARGAVLNEVLPSDLTPEQVKSILQLAKELDGVLPPADSPERDDAEASALKSKQEIEEMRKALSDSKRLQDRLEGQLANASRRLMQDGLGYPACWARKVGTPDYIFSIALRPDGIVIHDNKLRDWADEQKALPLNTAMYDRPLSESQFRSLTKPLYDASEKMDCRFFVQVFDVTGPQDKIRYKQLMQAVEGHFYKYQVANKNAWKGPLYQPAQAGP